MREGVYKIEYDVEGNKTVMDLYYDTGCAFRESFITSRIHKLVSTDGFWKILFFFPFVVSRRILTTWDVFEVDG